MTDIQRLPIARDKLVRLNGLSENLPLLEPTLTKGDVKYTADWISKQMQAVYDSTPKGEATATRSPARPQQVQAAAASTPVRPDRQRARGGEED